MSNTENSQTPDAPLKGQNESGKESTVNVYVSVNVTVNVENIDKFNVKEKSIHYEPEKSPNEIIPKEAQPNIEPKPPLSKDIATKLAGTNIIEPTKYGSCEVDWTDPHHPVVPGLNILAVCKNDHCEFHLKDAMCPKGIYPENNGYCSFDKDIHKVHCPV